MSLICCISNFTIRTLCIISFFIPGLSHLICYVRSFKDLRERLLQQFISNPEHLEQFIPQYYVTLGHSRHRRNRTYYKDMLYKSKTSLISNNSLIIFTR